MLLKTLKSLPRTLDATYERILLNIDEDHAEYARRILTWFAFSGRPLRLDEVAEIVAIDAGRETAFDEDEVLSDPLDICRICSSLVVVSGGAKGDENPDAQDSEHGDEQNIKASASDDADNPSLPPSQMERVLLLAHYSVKEYLVSVRAQQGLANRFSLQEGDCHKFIAQCCLKYLLQFGNAECLAMSEQKQSARGTQFDRILGQ